MELKHVIFLFGLMVCVPIGALLASRYRWIRDAVFFSLVFGTAMAKLVAINFVSREWYRGSTLGIEVASLDLLIFILIGGCLLAKRKDKPSSFWPPGLGPMLLYFAWCAISVGISQPKLFGLFELSKILRGILLFLAMSIYLRERRHLVLLVAALASVAMFEGAIGLRDRYLFHFHRIGATLEHPNSLSLFCCMITPALVATGTARVSKWLQVAAVFGALCGFLCVVLTISRTGVVTIASVSFGAALVCQDLRITPKRIAVGLLALLVGGGMLYKAKDSIAGRFGERSLEEEYSEEGIEGRGVYLRLAKDIFRDRKLGVGLNNWSYAVSGTYGPGQGLDYTPYDGTDSRPDQEVPYGSHLDNAQAPPAHNLLALTLGELGAPGLFLFLLLWLRWLSLGATFLLRRSPELVSRLGTGLLLGILAAFFQSGTEWIYRQTNIFFLFHMMAGALSTMARHRSWFMSATPATPGA